MLEFACVIAQEFLACVCCLGHMSNSKHVLPSVKVEACNANTSTEHVNVERLSVRSSLWENSMQTHVRVLEFDAGCNQSNSQGGIVWTLMDM